MKSASGYDIVPLTDAERDVLARDLTAEEPEVILDHGTERDCLNSILLEFVPEGERPTPSLARDEAPTGD